MKSSTRVFSLVASAAAALVMGGLVLWLLSLQSTKGLLAWVPTYGRMFTIACAAGLLPLLLALLGLIWWKRPDSKAGAVVTIASIALAGLVAVAVLIGIGEISLSSRKIGGPIPQLKLLNPSAGIQPHGPADLDGSPVLRLALASDPHWGATTSSPQARASILRSVDSETPQRDAFFILGDNVEMGWTDSFWREEAKDLKANLVKTPVRPILGNHDGLINGQYHFKKYFFPDQIKTDSGSPYYYSIDAGPAKLVVIDLLWGPEEFDATQRAWLERTLAATPQGKPIIVLSHCFVAASGYVDKGKPWFDHAENLAEIAPLLEKYKVSLMVSGHNHYMEYLERNGVAYALVDTMGGVLDPPPTHVSPFSKWLKQGSFGYLDLDVSAKGILLTFRDQDGKALHEAVIPLGAYQPI